MHRFFISQSDHVDDRQLLICSENLIYQFTKVLKFNVGEKVVVFDGSDYEWEVMLMDLSAKKIIGQVVEKSLCKTELPIRLVIAQAILKNMEKFEFVLQKGTELGVAAFVPLITDRTERKFLGKIDRLHRILKEATEQSGRCKMPKLLRECKFEKFFGNSEHLVIVSHPGIDMKFLDLMKKYKNLPKEILICVGPEGGFTDEEIDLAKQNGAKLVSLGPRILRAETVPLVIAGMIGQFERR